MSHDEVDVEDPVIKGMEDEEEEEESHQHPPPPDKNNKVRDITMDGIIKPLSLWNTLSKSARGFASIVGMRFQLTR